MYESVFVFGTKIFQETIRDAISALPLELSWKIFSYLDDRTLCLACRVCKLWKRIISANNNLKRRSNHFELVIKFGWVKRAKLYKANRKIMKKRNFLQLNKCLVSSSKSTMVSKRTGDNIFVSTKRYRLF